MKKFLAIICALVLFVLLVPQRHHVNDGGTVVYESVVYTIYDMHQFYTVSPADENGKRTVTHRDGIIIYILGHEVYSNTYLTN